MHYQRASATERRYMPPAVAVSVVAFAMRLPDDAVRGGQLSDRGTRVDSVGIPTIWLPLVRRTRAPFLGQWALPGGPIEWDEQLTDTAVRTLRDAARREPGHLEQLYSFGSVERSAEAQRLVTIAYWALYGERELAAAPLAGAEPVRAEPELPRRWDDPVAPVGARMRGEGSAALAAAALAQPAGENVAWFSVRELPPLAFDHADIIAHALARLRARTEYATVAHHFLGPEFTLSQLRSVTEAVLDQSVDPANFRRQALARGGLVDTGKLDAGGAHRPSRLYRFSASDGPPSEAQHPKSHSQATSPQANTRNTP